MIITEAKRIIKAGFLNFKRSGIISWAAVLVVTITLSVIASILILQAVLSTSLEEIKNKVDVTIYFNPGAPEDKIMNLKSSLENLPEVAEVSYVSADQALQDFRDRHKEDYPTIQALDELKDNPLGGYLNVKAKEVSQYESIANFLGGDNALASGGSSIIDKVNYHQNKIVIDRLNNIISGAQKLGFLTTLILIFISVIITFNTIRLTIFISKDEIAVMRLVGASKTRVSGPFMVEGAIYGIIATFVTLIIFFPITYYLGRNMTQFLGVNVYDYFLSNLLQISAIILLSGIVLGVISSVLATRKYLNK